ncbi:MAG: CsbD family protein [Anaerolineae bacterium]
MHPQLAGMDWPAMRARIQERWSDLTEEDLARLDARREELAGMLQEKYGYARAQAEREVAHLMHEARAYAHSNRMVLVGAIVALMLVVLVLIQWRVRLSRGNGEGGMR